MIKNSNCTRRSSVTITLENDVNVSRGDMIVKANELPKVEKTIYSCHLLDGYKAINIWFKICFTTWR